jgi:hypothetical protein
LLHKILEQQHREAKVELEQKAALEEQIKKLKDELAGKQFYL